MPVTPRKRCTIAYMKGYVIEYIDSHSPTQPAIGILYTYTLYMTIFVIRKKASEYGLAAI